MVEQWRESALAEQRHRREDREKIRLEAASKDRQMEEMASSQMKPEGVCPCGKHKGVAFMNGSIRLNPTLLCPLSVWLFWQKKGVVNSDWKQVLSERPIDEMLNNFRLGG
jgi:hypothetical protein